MSVTAIKGSQFTVTIGATAYSGQVTGANINRTTPVTSIPTLGDMAYVSGPSDWAVAVDFLYDEETGLYGALNTAQGAGTGLSVAIVGGDAKWTGTMYVSDASVQVTADGVATASANFVGSLTLADAP